MKTNWTTPRTLQNINVSLFIFACQSMSRQTDLICLLLLVVTLYYSYLQDLILSCVHKCIWRSQGRSYKALNPILNCSKSSNSITYWAIIQGHKDRPNYVHYLVDRMQIHHIEPWLRMNHGDCLENMNDVDSYWWQRYRWGGICKHTNILGLFYRVVQNVNSHNNGPLPCGLWLIVETNKHFIHANLL